MFRKILLAVVAGIGFCGSTSIAQAGDAKQQVQELFNEEAKLRDSKKYVEAMEVLKKILEVEPRNSWAFSEAAWLLNENKQYELAMAHAEQAIEFNINNSDAWRELGYSLMMLNRYSEASKALTTAVQKNPRNWHAHDYLIESYEKMGKFNAAATARASRDSELAKARAEEAAKVTAEGE